MTTITFNYSNGQGTKVEPNVPINHLVDYKNKWINYIDKRYNGKLISPIVYIFLTNNRTEITNAALLADGVLN
jgi:hypothetical protein